MSPKCKALSNINFLKLLYTYSRKRGDGRKIKSLLNNSNVNEIKAVSELLHNIIHKKLKCNTGKLKSLSKFKKSLRDLSNVKISNKKKKKIN